MKQFESNNIRFIFILLSNFLFLMQGYCLKMFYTYFCMCTQECTHATGPMWKLKESFLSSIMLLSYICGSQVLNLSHDAC